MCHEHLDHFFDLLRHPQGAVLIVTRSKPFKLKTMKDYPLLVRVVSASLLLRLGALMVFSQYWAS